MFKKIKNNKIVAKTAKKYIPATVRLVDDLGYSIKKRTLYRLFWGRGGFYKIVTHTFIIILTISTLVGGIYTRFSSESSGKLLGGFQALGNIDLMQQGGSVETLIVRNPRIYFNVFDHRVKDGETLDSIAQSYGVSKDTVKWANPKINYFTEIVRPNDILKIPEINGVLYEVKEGDTLDSVLSKTSGDRFQVIELNNLEGPEFKLAVGSRVLVPDGSLPPPPPPPPEIPPQNPWRVPLYVGQNIYAMGEYNGLPLISPMSNPACGGYIVTRGWGISFDGFHNGLDLAKYGGCPLRSIADGVVMYAGWSPWGEGYTVRIDHGNGLSSYYLHGETLWVQTGERVTMGEEIMHMGSTGNSTGTHLHISIKINGSHVDPALYIPY